MADGRIVGVRNDNDGDEEKRSDAMGEQATYRIHYLGIGGVEEQQRFIGDLAGLAIQITMIEGGGGQQLVATHEHGERIVYECGGFVV